MSLWPTSCGFKNVDMQAIMEVAILLWTRLGAALPDTRQNSTLIHEQASGRTCLGNGLGARPLPGLHYLSGITKKWRYTGRIGCDWPGDWPWYAHLVQHGEHDWQEPSGIFRRYRGYPRDGPLHEMHGERTPWPGVGVWVYCGALCSAVQRVVVLLHLSNALVRHSNSCSART